MKPELPKPIADYVEANARLDVDAMLKPFTANAVVLDIRSRYEGHAELRKLFEREVVPVRAIFTPESIHYENGRHEMGHHEKTQVVVTGPAHGDFKGSPIQFTYRFTLAKDAIEALEITV